MTKFGLKKKKDFVFSFILNYLQNPFVPCGDTLLNPFSESLLDDLDRLWELKTILPDPSDPTKLYKG